jgi:uracil-DNA glycosylase family 4
MTISLELLPSKPTCTACDLHLCAKSVGVPSRHLPTSLPSIPTNPVVIVLGMNPGNQEDRANQCWIGPSGQLLTGPYLQGSGVIDQASIYLCNIARCVSPGGKPKPAHYRTCITNTISDINAILDYHAPAKSRAILCAGADPVTQFTRTFQKKAMSQQDAFRAQGILIPTLPRTHLFATYHPAAVLREPGLIHPVSDHMALLSAFLTGKLAKPSLPTIVPAFYPKTTMNDKHEADYNNDAFRRGTING